MNQLEPYIIMVTKGTVTSKVKVNCKIMKLSWKCKKQIHTIVMQSCDYLFSGLTILFHNDILPQKGLATFNSCF